MVDGIFRRLESDVVYSVIGFYTDALIDFVDPFLPPTLALLAVQVLVLFGLRFTPW